MAKKQTADEISSIKSLKALSEKAESCHRCDLYKNATQTVFGKGSSRASIMIVGEQPGNKEDLAGLPFVGPAGAMLVRCLEEAGIDPKEVYLTNAVKHFKFEPEGKARIHKKPNGAEVKACKPWLQQEIALVKPEIIIALGVTAAQSLFGKPLTISRLRGKALEQDQYKAHCFLSWHPSSILRSIHRDDAEVKRLELVNDLKLAQKLKQ